MPRLTSVFAFGYAETGAGQETRDKLCLGGVPATLKDFDAASVEEGKIGKIDIAIKDLLIA